MILTGQLWKIATGGAAALAVLLIALLIASSIETRDLISQRNQLSERINDPKTGYVVQLAQARTNEQTLKLVVEREKANYQAMSDVSNAKLAAAETRLAVAQAETKRAQAALNTFLATGPKGTTLDERVRDIDARALEEFVK